MLLFSIFNLFLNSESCVPIPTGHIPRLQTRYCWQPIAIIAAVPIAIASAPIAIALAKSAEVLRPPVITSDISSPCSSKYFLARYNAYIVGTVVASFIILGLAPVAKSGFAKQANSKSSSICPAANFTPIGLPSDFSLNSSTRAFKSFFVAISLNLDGLIISSPTFLPLIFAISSVTFSPGRCPPIPGFVP